MMLPVILLDMMKSLSTPHTPMPFSFASGHLCLDFVNTETMWHNQRHDLLPTIAHYITWLTTADLLTTDVATQAHERWSQTEHSQTLLTWVQTFRQQLRVMLEAVVRGEAVASTYVMEINRWLAFQGGQFRLIQTTDGFDQQWQIIPTIPEHLLVPVAVAAADLLSAHDLTLIKHCDNPQCLHYFYDTTKNHSRRWCSMGACGNRTKVAAYYQRKRQREQR